MAASVREQQPQRQNSIQEQPQLAAAPREQAALRLRPAAAPSAAESARPAYDFGRINVLPVPAGVVQPELQSGGTGPAVAPPVVQEALSAPGRPLEQSARSFMEERFGHDFGRVRVHADARAAVAADAVRARAYTVGSDIVFGAGQYEPSTAEGRRLLAHELTHVLQQRTGRTGSAAHAGPLTLSRPNDAAERQADLAADALVAGRPASAEPWRSPEADVSLQGVHPTRESVGEPPSATGRVDQPLREEDFEGGTAVGGAHYSWGVIENLLWVEVRMRFQPAPPPANRLNFWLHTIRDTWNRFHAVNTATNERVYIRFQPEPVTGNQHVTINVLSGTGEGHGERANEYNWYAGEAFGLQAAHEFGHIIGLQDEYHRLNADLERITGTRRGPGRHPNMRPQEFVERLHAALHAPAPNSNRDPLVGPLIQGIETGSWTDAVALDYRATYHIDLYDEIRRQMPGSWIQASTINLFFPAADSIMGMEGGIQGITPRPYHMREFVRLIASVRGGRWEAREG